MRKHKNEEERLKAIAEKDWSNKKFSKLVGPFNKDVVILTNEEYMELFNADCDYCGDEIKANYIEAGDENQPIHKGNSVAICPECKRLKGDKSRDKFIKDSKKQ